MISSSITVIAKIEHLFNYKSGEEENLEGWGPNVFYMGKYYPGRIIKVDRSYPENVVITVGILTGDERLDIPKGAEMELRSGPEKLIAKITVVDVLE